MRSRWMFSLFWLPVEMYCWFWGLVIFFALPVLVCVWSYQILLAICVWIIKSFDDKQT